MKKNFTNAKNMNIDALYDTDDDVDEKSHNPNCQKLYDVLLPTNVPVSTKTNNDALIDNNDDSTAFFLNVQ